MKIRELFSRFEPYGWEASSAEIAERVGLRPEQIVRLDTNTSPYVPRSSLKELAARFEDVGVNEYPDTSYIRLREGLSAYAGKRTDRFVVTNGADEGLDIVTKTLLDPGDEVIVPVPSYSMFRVVTELMGAKVMRVARRGDFSVQTGSILRSVGARTKLIFLCNPNNPTGNSTPVEDIRELAESGVAIVIDEAYFEFSGTTAADLTDRYDNVIVCRTFSKAFSMAGVRVGYLLAKRSTADQLNLVRPPNSLSVISLLLAESALAHPQEMRSNVRRVVEERRRLFGMLEDVRGVHPYPSEANFILFKLEGAEASKVHARLMKKGFVLRDLSSLPGVENCLRTTVSTPSVGDAFVAALRVALGR